MGWLESREKKEPVWHSVYEVLWHLKCIILNFFLFVNFIINLKYTAHLYSSWNDPPDCFFSNFFSFLMHSLDFLFPTLVLSFSLPLYHQHTYTSENNIWNYTIWKQFILTVVFKWVLLLKAWSSLFCSCLTTDKKNISCNKSSLVCSMFWEWYLPKGQMSHLQSRGVMQLQCHHRVRNIWESGHSPHPSEHRWQSAHCGGLPFPSCWPDEFPSRPFSSLALYSPFPTEDAKGQHLLALRADRKKTQVVGKSS